MSTLKYRNNEVQRVYIGGSFRVTDPEGLTARPTRLATRTFVALPMQHNKYTGFRTVLNPRQERCSPEYP